MNNDSFIEMNGIRQRLADVEADIWAMLTNGSLHPEDAFRTATLASQASTGIGLRTVVLRKAEVATKMIFFHSDNRATKISEIRAQPAVSCLFYDDHRRVQVRLSGQGFVHVGDRVADEHWQQLPVTSRKAYLSQHIPSSVTEHPTDGLPAQWQGRVLPTPHESEAGKPNFAVIRCQIDFADWLWLGENGHRRAQFFYQNGLCTQMQWVIP